MSIDEQFMDRCITLAKLGAGKVSPNPMVGAVLVYEGSIVGEGYHEIFGGAHAEVNCINSVSKQNQEFISKSTLYVSLEPCAHFGKTPPCSQLIVSHKIEKVVIGCTDIYKEVSGRGIAQLKDAGIEVATGILEQQCIELNKRFFCFHEKKRPYIILKWAQSFNSKIGAISGERILISNDYSNRLVHKWRSEEDAILIGTATALKDDPNLTTRLWKGNNPVRVVIDKDLKFPSSLNVFNDASPSIIFNNLKNDRNGNIQFIKIEGSDFLTSLLQSLYNLNIQSILVEGGSKTLQSFIDAGLWDEARVITNTELNIVSGVDAPELKDGKLETTEMFFTDLIHNYKRTER
ncbi:MAG: bifunctional diaminohydroxyphosphoribosylaminopyrimidine deaminase/5-amino-6-(5-phosphoribosylamino)uracil reductase RibD [Ginsengibacter sp.]